MILVCPSCDAKFKVPDGAITAEGRKVRCARCQHSWHATPAHALKPAAKPAPNVALRATPPHPDQTADIDAVAAARAAALRKAVVEEDTSPAPDSHDEDPFDEGIEAPAPPLTAERDDRVNIAEDFDLETHENHDDHEPGLGVDEDALDDADEATSADELWQDVGLRRRVSERTRLVWKRRVIMALWAGLLVFVLGLLGTLLFNKEGVTTAFPGTHQLYDFFSSASTDAIDKYRPEEGEPLSTPLGEIDVYVSADLYTNLTRFEEIDGKNQLAVRGFVENTGSRAAYVPQVQISIKDGRGRTLDQWLHEPQGLMLRRGQQLQFETFRHPVPEGMASVEVKALEGTRSTVEAPSQ